MFSWFKQLMHMLRGGASKSEITLGIWFGLAAGIIPGVNLTVILFIFLLFILNANGIIAGLFYALGKALCLLLAPLTFQLGYFLIHSLGLEGVIRLFADTPILALFNLHIYSVLGGLILALIFGTIIALWIAKLLVVLRIKAVTKKESSEAISRWNDKKWVRLCVNLVFGKSLLHSELVHKKAIRKGRVVLVLTLVAMISLIQLIFLDGVIKKSTIYALEKITSTSVNIESVSVSLLQGVITFNGVEAVSKKDPKINAVQAQTVQAQISIIDLLARRVILDNITAQGVKINEPRDKAFAKNNVKDKKTKGGWLDKLNVDTLKNLVGQAGEIKDIAKNLQNISEKFKKDEAAVAKDAAGRKEQLDEKRRLEGYLTLSAQEYLRKHPAWVVKEARFENIYVNDDIAVNVQLNDISSHPSLYGSSPVVDVSLNESGKKASKDTVKGAINRLF